MTDDIGKLHEHIAAQTSDNVCEKTIAVHVDFNC